MTNSGMTNKRFFALITAIFSILFCACDGVNDVKYNKANSSEISIGIVYPASRVGENVYFFEGINFAREYINENGGLLGKSLNLVIRDDEADANLAMRIAQTFYEQGITAVVGHWSTNVCYYVEDVYESNGVVMLTPRATGLNLFETNFNYVFRMTANNNVFAQSIAFHLHENGFTRPVIYFTDDQYGRDFSQIMEENLANYGVLVVDRITSISHLSLKTTLNRWRAFGVDSIIFTATYPNYLDAMSLLNGIYPIFGADNFDYLHLSQNAQLDLQQIYKIVIARNSIDEGFLLGFFERYGHYPDLAAVFGYQAVTLISDSIKATGRLDGNKIANYLSNLREYQAVWGKLSYNKEVQEFEHYNIEVDSIASQNYEKNQKN